MDNESEVKKDSFIIMVGKGIAAYFLLVLLVKAILWTAILIAS